ncbi:hypothetical protein SAMN05421771_3759 [Granulicella pectinivorans]|uniref:Uncharacterized protein n=1 Tax=Granulicella pectinivorans TaxID=474950 RepID=A0A1I6MY89_9BACT|nr:hypothetical protein [Granulicella pectinivorans]SFS20675.1 hypothetical protein SAMN05421771_3759 [Granulicella pectinivorans]
MKSALRNTVFLLFALLVTPPFAASAQGITAVSGWRASAEADPFAKPDPTSVMTSATPVGLSGLRVSLRTGCSPEYGGYFSIFLQLQGAAFDADKGTEVHSSPRIFGGTNVYSTNYNNIYYQTRIDNGEPVKNPATALDGTDHSFRVDFTNDSLTQGRQALIGAKTGGRPITLQINLKDPVFAHALRLCTTASAAVAKERSEKEAAEAKAAADSREAYEAYAKLKAEADATADRERKAALKADTERRQLIESQQHMPGPIQGELTLNEQAYLKDFTRCLSVTKLGPPPMEALYRQGYDAFIASPALDKQLKQLRMSQAPGPSSKWVRLNLVFRTTRPVKAVIALGGQSRGDLSLPANTLFTVFPESDVTAQGCHQTYTSYDPVTMTRRIGAFLITANFGNFERYYIPADAVAYATDAQAWCKDHCLW